MRVRNLPHLIDAFVTAERPNIKKFDMPWRRRAWLYRHGFLSIADSIYDDLGPETVADYLSDYRWRRTRRINEPNSPALRNEILFRSVVGQTHPELLPDLYGVTRDGQLVEGLPWESVADSSEALRAIIREEPVVCKPINSAAGEGVSVVDYDADADAYTINGRHVHTDAALAPLMSLNGPTVATEHITQAEYAQTIYPDATNTIRILTMISPETGEAFIGAAVHRFGANGSVIDNWSAGGISVAIDTDTGELGEGVTSPKAGAATVTRTATHPDTGNSFIGTAIPNWKSIKRKTLDLAEEYGWMWPYVGWDVVVTDDDGSMIILEGNRMSDIDLLQTHEPLLADERVRDFYEHHGII